MPRGVKNGVNQSEAIREYLTIHPTASPLEIKQALAAKGLKPSDSLINAVKYRRSKKGKGKKKPGPKKGRAAPAQTKSPAGERISIDALVAAGDLVRSLGGADNAIKLINVLKQVGK
jgi:hypothetical protein